METYLSMFHVSMASKKGATTLTVTDLSFKARQARGDGTGQFDHKCMTLEVSPYRGVAGEVVGILHQDDMEMLEEDCLVWPKARWL